MLHSLYHQAGLQKMSNAMALLLGMMAQDHASSPISTSLVDPALAPNCSPESLIPTPSTQISLPLPLFYLTSVLQSVLALVSLCSLWSCGYIWPHKLWHPGFQSSRSLVTRQQNIWATDSSWFSLHPHGLALLRHCLKVGHWILMSWQFSSGLLKSSRVCIHGQGFSNQGTAGCGGKSICCTHY